MENKEEIVKLLEFIFEPIGASEISFGESFDMYCSIRHIGSVESIYEEKNKITFYPIEIKTNLGELRICLHSTDLNNLKFAIGIAYSYSGFHQKNKINDAIALEIQKRIYNSN